MPFVASLPRAMRPSEMIHLADKRPTRAWARCCRAVGQKSGMPPNRQGKRPIVSELPTIREFAGCLECAEATRIRRGARDEPKGLLRSKMMLLEFEMNYVEAACTLVP